LNTLIWQSQLCAIFVTLRHGSEALLIKTSLNYVVCLIVARYLNFLKQRIKAKLAVKENKYCSGYKIMAHNYFVHAPMMPVLVIDEIRTFTGF
jgi:hypothetical protein